MQRLIRRPCLLAVVMVLGSVATSALAAEALVTEIVPIGYRKPQQLLSILEPLVPAPGKLAATDDHLIVTTTRDNLRQIKDILAALDRPPRNLLVTVRYGKSGTADGIAGRASVKIDHEDPPNRHTKPHHGSVAVEVWHTKSASDSQRDQHLRVIAGARACISHGELAPVGGARVLFIHNALLGIEAATRYIDLSTGFCVVPRVRGGQVLLEIAPQSAQMGLNDYGTVETETIRTTVSVPLGHWVEIGAIGQQHHDRHSGLYLSTQTTEAVFVKVDEVSP